MAHLRPELKTRFSIEELILPGTHDSAATGKFHANLSPLLSQNKQGSQVFNNMVRTSKVWHKVWDWTFHRWVACQDIPIKTQLEIGARYLDLRVAYSPQLDRLFTSHSFFIDHFEHALDQILDFLSEHPGEIILLQVKPDFHQSHHMTDAVHHRVLSTLEQTFGALLLPNTSQLRNMSIHDLQLSGHRVICYYYGNLPESVMHNLPWHVQTHAPMESLWKIEWAVDFQRKWLETEAWLQEIVSMRRQGNAEVLAKNYIFPFTLTPNYAYGKSQFFNRVSGLKAMTSLLHPSFDAYVETLFDPGKRTTFTSQGHVTVCSKPVVGVFKMDFAEPWQIHKIVLENLKYMERKVSEEKGSATQARKAALASQNSIEKNYVPENEQSES